MKHFHPKKIVRLAKEKIHDVFWYYLVPDRWEIRHRFRKKVGYVPNLRHPVTFNEKIQWLKLHDHDSRYPLLIDKFRVKAIVGDVIGEEHIIKTLCGPFSRFDDIPFKELPERFVIKCNHDAASTVICKDKSSFNYSEAKEKLEKSLRTNYYHQIGKQWGYRDIEPYIFVEEYMQDADKSELEDYKFMVFNGKCRCVFVCSGRNSTGLMIDVYDEKWNLLPIRRDCPNSKKNLPKPDNFEEMLKMAEKLAVFVGNAFVRVDVYDINDRIYFGELTFYPNGGFGKFHPQEWDYTLGSWIKLPIDK